MNQHTVYKRFAGENPLGFSIDAETVFLGVIGPVTGQNRVRVANQQSRFVRPADLDAALQGYFNS